MHAASHGAQLQRDAAGSAGCLRSAVLLRPHCALPPPSDKRGHAHAMDAFLAHENSPLHAREQWLKSSRSMLANAVQMQGGTQDITKWRIAQKCKS